MSEITVSERVLLAHALRTRFDALGIPEFAQAVPVGSWLDGATWWQVTGHGEAANEPVHSMSWCHQFAKEAVRAHAITEGLRLSEIIHDDELEGWSH